MSWFKTKKQNLMDNLKEEQIYELVAFEVSTKDIRPGLWAKAYERANGDEVRAKAAYIKLRAEQVKLGNDVAEDLILQFLRQAEAERKVANASAPDNLLDAPTKASQVKVKGWSLTCKFCNGSNVEPPEISSKKSAYCYDCARYLAWGTEALSTTATPPRRSCSHCGSTNLGLSGSFYSVICKDCNQFQ